MKKAFVKLAMVAVYAASALSVAAGDFPKANLELWLSAGQVEQTNSVIMLIKDLSGQANDARRDPPSSVPATNPALAEDVISRQPVLRFSGADIAFVFRRLSDIRTAFWVVSKDAAAFGKRNEKFVLGDRESNDFHAGWTDDTIFNTDVNPGHLSKYLADGKTWLNGRAMVASKTPFPKQLSLISISSAGPVRANQLARDRNFSGRSWQGDIAEVLLYNVELSDADRQAVEKYLLHKYALQSAAENSAITSNPTSSIPAGWVLIKSKGQSFQMGQEFPGRRWTNTFPVHQVSFTYDFVMEATQVTQAEYHKVAGVNPTKHPGDERRPIDNVSWFDAVLYCNALSKREGLDAVYAFSGVTRNPTNNEVVDLPGLTIDIKKNGYRLLTSAEYEYVVRAGTTTTWFFGDSNADQNRMALR